MRQEQPLRNRNALVCGASAGIGRAIALALAERGARVTGLARRPQALLALVEELKANGADDPSSITADMDDRVGLDRRVAEALQTRGPFHILVNNSGGPRSGPMAEMTTVDFEAAFRRHVLVAHELVLLVLPGMRAAGYGRIVNITSIAAREPIVNLGVSNTIRAAVAGWAKTWSRELPPNITINNVLPGYTDTERLRELGSAVASRTGAPEAEVREGWVAGVPEGRLARPDEVAAAVSFLVSPSAGYIRGVSLPVDGGRLAAT